MAQKYQIKLDITGITRKNAAQIVAEQFSATATSKDGDYEVKDRLDRLWQFRQNESVRPECKNVPNSYYATKIITPFCIRKDMPTIEQMMQSLENAGAITNKSCKMQINIDRAGHTEKSLQNLVNTIKSKCDILNKALATGTPQDKMIDFENEQSLNFNMFPATVSADEIKSYVQLATAMCVQAVEQNNISPKKPSMDNEKYSFRGWTLQLGMKGDEFKTARKVLFENLDGNVAWRDPKQAADQRKRLEIQPEMVDNSLKDFYPEQSPQDETEGETEEQGIGGISM